ncbi:hypothetical protein QFZ72_003267 [Bacillus sp. V2I10]|nr:hypothetical protein [Bacillus sp. V2I10]
MFILFSIVFAMTVCKSEKTIKEGWKDNSPYFITEYGEIKIHANYRSK